MHKGFKKHLNNNKNEMNYDVLKNEMSMKVYLKTFIVHETHQTIWSETKESKLNLSDVTYAREVTLQLVCDKHYRCWKCSTR